MTVAPITISPTFFSTGILSPVSADSSTAENPSIISPSTGILCPGRTTIISPFCTSSTAISISLPSLSIVAFLGAKSSNLVIASDVFPLERVSIYFPTVINVNIIPDDSK